MIDAHSPLLARLERAPGQAALDRAAVPLLLFERYRRALRRWSTPAAAAPAHAPAPARSRVPGDDLRARLAARAPRPPERGDELLLGILQAVEVLEQGDGLVAQAALETAYAGWVEYAVVTYDAGDVDAATYIVAEVGADAELSGHFMLAARARDYEGLLALRAARIDESEALFRRAEQLARRSGSASMVYRARIGLANLLRLRGNLPAAEAMFERIIRGARRNAPDVVPRARLMLASVAHARGRYATAVALATRAAHEATDERIRARILIELAALFVEFADSALADTARQILEHAAVYSPEHATRQYAGISLLSLAIDQRHRDEFAKWRATLRTAALAPRQTVEYALLIVRGLQAFALPDDPIPYLDDAERIAAAHGMAQFVFRIGEERERVARTPAGGAESVTPDAGQPLPIASASVHTAARRVAALLVASAASTGGWED